MVLDPFEIVGTWRLTSEESDELLSFKPDGTYRIYYEVPFRLIELGEWQINRNRLIFNFSNINISCKIDLLRENKMVFSHISDTNTIIKDKYERRL